MKPKVTEIDKLKYWIDAEISFLHILFAIIMLQLTEGLLPTILLSVYITYHIIYAFARIIFVASVDKDYLKLPNIK